MDNTLERKSISPSCLRTYTSQCLLLFVILSVLIFQGQTIYQNPPPYFSSFYCNLGTKTMAQGGTYFCTSPKVIERADKFALSLVEFNKVPSVNIWFKAEVIQTSGTNLVSVEIRLDFKTAYTTRYGYMVVVIGQPPENTWLDLIYVKLPQNPADSQVSMTNSGGWKSLDRVFAFPSSETFLSTYTHFFRFISSFGIQTTNPSDGGRLNLDKPTGSATSLTIRILTSSANTIKTIFWGVLVFDQSAMPLSTAYKFSSQFSRDGSVTLTDNFHVGDLKQYGAPFNTKCLIGYRYIFLGQYGLNDRTITLLNFTSNNYFKTQTSSADSIYIGYTFILLCFAETSSQVAGDFEFFDSLTGIIYTDVSQCPLAPTASSPNQCKKCSQIQCINCNVTNRAQCYSCGPGLFTQIVGQTCECIPWSLRSTTSQLCQPCVQNCLTCVINNCPRCQVSYGITSSGLCEPCFLLGQNCIGCQAFDAGCTQCIAANNIYLLGDAALGIGFCKACSQIDSNCIECSPNDDNSDLICSSKCPYGYFVNSLQRICIHCSQAIPNCLECFESPTTLNVQCTSCSDKFLVDQNFKCESCKVGIYYKSECYQFPGCSSFYFIDDRLSCLACTHANFQFNQKVRQCICQIGFILNAIKETCSGKCGDGIKVFLQSCDDGNLINGDGCDENCHQQENFLCSEDSSSKTKCILSYNINITPLSVLKVENENKAEIRFNITPSPTTLDFVDWQKTMVLNFNFNSTERKPIISFQYSKGILVVTLGFFNDIQGATGIAEIKFDQSIIKSRPSYIYIELKGQNSQLMYQNQQILKAQKVVTVASQVVGIMSLVCFMVSTFFHKMIGLETLQFVQLIYFTRIIFTRDSQLTVTAFNSLKFSNGFSDINLHGQDWDASLNSMHSIFQAIKMRMYYLDNCNLMLIPLLLGSFIFWWYQIRSFKAKSNYLQNNDLLQKGNYFNSGRKATLVYDCLIFPYSMGILYLTIFQMLIYAWSDLSNESNTDTIYYAISYGLSLAILQIIFFILCSEAIEGLKTYFKGLSNKENHFSQEKALEDRYTKDYHPLYVPFYLCYQISLLVLMSTAILEFEYLTEVMMGLIIIYSLVFFFWQPYNLRIHNFANIFHQAIVVSFLSLSILGKYNLLNDTLKIVGLYLTIVLIVVALMLQMIRIYVYKKSFKRQFKLENKQNKQTLEQIKSRILRNPYTLQNQLASIIRDNGLNIQFDNSKKMEREELLENFEEVAMILEQIERQKNNTMVQVLKEDSREYFKRLNKSLRKGFRPHLNRILQ